MRPKKTLKIITASFGLLFLFNPETNGQTLSNSGAAINVSAGATLTVAGSIENTQAGAKAPAIENNGTIQVSGNWQNHSNTQYSGTGTLELNGTGAQEFSSTNLYNLTISGNGSKTTTGNSSIQNSLFFAQGVTAEILTVPNADTLELSTTATISETATGFVTGWLRTTRTLAQNTFYNFGGMGLEFNAHGAVPGATTIIRGTGPTAIQTGEGNEGIARVFMISPANNSNLNADITFFYHNNELNDLPQNELMLFKSTDKGLNWIPVGYSSRNMVTNSLAMNGVNSFSWWTAGSAITPLPVSWLYFRCTDQQDGNLINWATASEKNSEAFIVERSENGRDFSPIGRVGAAGSSNQKLTYAFTDKNRIVFDQKVLYYRLKQTDFDGAFEYSSVVTISRLPEQRLPGFAYPNPFKNDLNLQLNESFFANERVIVTMHNAIGQAVYKQEISSIQTKGSIQLSNLQMLPAGIYILKLESGNSVWKTKVIKD